MGSTSKEAFANSGLLIYPTYLNVSVGKERALTVYVKRSLVNDPNEAVSVESDSPDALSITGSPFSLHPHRSKADRLLGTFIIKGCQVKDAVVLTAKCNGLPTAQALAQVVPEATEQRDFTVPVEFECKEYSVRIGSRKSLRLFAKSPEVVAEETLAKTYSADGEKVTVRGKCVLVPVTASNYAEGSVVVEGRSLKAKTTVTAEVNGRTATTLVKVIDKPEDSQSVPIEIRIMDEDYGNFRARWADREKKPNLLLISARHKSLSRYLGPPPAFPGQDSPLFRVLIAEIVAESVCRKSLTMEAKERPWDFRWADLKEDNLIADDVLSKMQQRLRDFVAEAHAIMLRDSEIKAQES